MGILLLLLQCGLMFAASMLCGSIPLMFKSAMSGTRLQAISVLGMGLLVGAALTIIIPEGVSTLFEAKPDGEHASKAIGLSLLAGFALMLTIESLTPHPPHSRPPSPDIEEQTSSIGEDEEEAPVARPHSHHQNSSTPILYKRAKMQLDERAHGPHSHGVAGLNATLGLVIHGAADGVALGASSLSGRGSLGVVVFLAVLVHKGPTALGLTTTLLSLCLEPPAIRKRLMIFSFAAPIGAILTFLIVRIGGHVGDDSSLDYWTGIALLFSGGSFLYVATVIQPLSADDHSHGAHDHDEGLGKYQRTGLLMLGMVLPILLSALVGHGH